ncbi:hypothetical protein GFL80_25780 [Rhizobium leguminosarum bv. viciae]|uniref:hypothetical protein n=1 Tax=Rhizobium leguminosarum TaxID=384 RepID=UPI0014428A13|nr:hypothetical protein [Rhizobium leguminosarum]NKK87572.1 hypothetical protein [Rhizobium leguminosarum bv. viciae]
MSREHGNKGWDRVASAINSEGRPKADNSNASASWQRVVASIDVETDQSRLYGVSVAEQQRQAAASSGIIRMQKAAADRDNPRATGSDWAEQLMEKLLR